jgi:hypothetical protein
MSVSLTTTMTATIASAIVGYMCGCGFAPITADEASASDANPSGHADAATDAATDAAANTMADAMPDSAVMFTTLRETTDDVYTNGNSDQCLIASATQAQTYERVFPLSMFAVMNDLHVTAISFVAVEASGANGVTVEIGTYAGSVSAGTTTLDVNAITWLATALVDVPNDATSQTVSVSLAATLHATDSLIVGIASPSYAGIGGTFVVGGTASSQTLPSFWMASACSTSSPSTRDGRNSANVGTFIIDVAGYTP